MNILTGFLDHAVLQRDARGRSTTRVTGTASQDGRIHVQVRRGSRRVLKQPAGRIRNGRFDFTFRGIPAGGPYRIDIAVDGRRVESCCVKDVWVGDVWILAGQSNMEGCGILDPSQPADCAVRAFHMSDRWRIARDPIHDIWASKYAVTAARLGGPRAAGQPPHGVGPGLSFGKTLRRLTGVPQGLIVFGHGGSRMEDWDPALASRGDHSLYGALRLRVQRAGGYVAGMAWYQGESDASPEQAARYTERTATLFQALRRDLRMARLPIVLAQISRYISAAPAEAWNAIQDQQYHLPETVKYCAVVPTLDARLDDGVHLNGASQVVVGERLAHAMRSLTERDRKKYPPPIRRGKIRVEKDRCTDLIHIVVEFLNVQGKLQSAGRAAGFSVLDQNGQPIVFDTLLDNACVRLRVGLLANARVQGLSLQHGRGFDPYCNVTDAAGNPLPAFGPFPLQETRSLTGFIGDVAVSPVRPSAGRLDGLDYPENPGALGLVARRFAPGLCDMHEEIGRNGEQDGLVYFATHFTVSEPMELVLYFGYDGPAKLWLNGRSRCHDPHGCNPARPLAQKIPIAAQPGRDYSILAALGTNHGKAWGIFLSMDRLDVPRARRGEASKRCAMPVFSAGLTS